MSQFSKWSTPDLEIIDESFSNQLEIMEMKCSIGEIKGPDLEKLKFRMSRIVELKNCIHNELEDRDVNF